MGMLNRLLQVKNCSWCHQSLLWGRIRLPFHLVWVNQSHGICKACSRRLVQEMDRCHHVAGFVSPGLELLAQESLRRRSPVIRELKAAHSESTEELVATQSAM
jgi:hypothetical protein